MEVSSISSSLSTESQPSTGMLSLALLGQSTHPLMEQGYFSVFNDCRVTRHTSNDTICHLDLDGIVIASRSLDAFRIGLFGEARGYTTGKVQNLYTLIQKMDFVTPDMYDAMHKVHYKFVPGFNFMDGLVSGVQLKVLGRLRRTCSLGQELEDIKLHPERLKEQFFRTHFLPALSRLPPLCRTRQNNLVISRQQGSALPEYFRLYPEDIQSLGQELDTTLRAIGNNEFYEFYFAYFRFGQQQVISPPLTLSGTNLDLIVADPAKVEKASCHFALNFQHSDTTFSLFWDLSRTSIFMPGRERQHKYPFMGLGEIGNVTMKAPQIPLLAAESWPSHHLQNINLTYIQAYTQYTKPMGNFHPFSDHPFLLTYLLGKEYVRSNKDFVNIVDSIDNKKDYLALHESIILQLQRTTCRMELVVSSANLDSILAMDVGKLTKYVEDRNLLIQIPSADMVAYCSSIIDELYAPLEASIVGAGSDRASLPTVLMCETILSLLPSMSTKDAPYDLLKDYLIAPMESGVISTERRLLLSGCAVVREDNLLYLPHEHIRRVYLPLQDMPSTGRRQAIRMVKFLEEMKTVNRRTIADKAAVILVEMHIEELVSSKMIPSSSAVKRAGVLTRAGISICDIVCNTEYVQRVFDLQKISANSRLRAFLKTAIDVTSTEVMMEALGKELLRTCSYIPRVVIHESALNFSPTSFCVLSPKTLSQVREHANTGRLTKEECIPFLRGAEATLIKSFDMRVRQSQRITRFNPETLNIATALLRELNLQSGRVSLAIFVVALVEHAKLKGFLPPGYSTRDFQRRYNVQRTTALHRIRSIVSDATN